MQHELTRLHEGFPSDDWPVVNCPECGVGYLSPLSDSFKVVRSVMSLKYADSDDWDPTYEEGVFQGVLACQRKACSFRAVVSGKWETLDVSKPSSRSAHFENMYFVRHIYPPVKALSIFTPAKTPKSIAVQVEKADFILWTDPSAAANCLRKAVEEFLTWYGVNRFEITKKRKRRALNLSERLDLFYDYEGETSDIFKAVKTIGNQGSHENSLTVEEVIVAAKILGHGLEIFFGEGSKNLEKTIKRINRKTKPKKK